MYIYYVIKTNIFILAFTKVPLAVFTGDGRTRRYQMEKLNPEKVAAMLKEKGVEVSVEQAASILKFLRKLANIVVAQYLKGGKHEA
ncbi:MAG: hypothetical protein WD824_18405 [Cyclobacteriaceae bacterium]